MFKYSLILSAIIVLVVLPWQDVNAFKVIAIHQGPPPPKHGPAAPALDPNALLQGVSSAVSGKLQQVQTLVGGLVQTKASFTWKFGTTKAGTTRRFIAAETFVRSKCFKFRTKYGASS
uniref:Salivary secreted peptide n=1 Tax=Glossina morsitans morsitans TaxID=37546 RepID=A0ABK9N7C8_GLOMM